LKPFSTFKVVFPSFLLLIVLSFISLYLFISNEIKEFYYEEKTNELLVHTELIAISIDPEKINDPEYINEFCKGIDPGFNIRLTIIRFDGQVIGDSHENPNLMDNHISRPEIVLALENRTGTANRYSSTLQKEMLYFAQLYDINETPIIIRTSLPDESLGATLDLLQTRLMIGGLIILLLGTILSYFISKTIASPIIKLTNQVHHIRIGNLRERIRLKGTKEILSLTESFNDLARQLADRIDSITVQSNEQKAILTSMIEGIIATDNGGKIIRINPAAKKILEIDKDDIVGENITSITHNKELIYYFEQYLNQNDLGLQEITIPSLKQKIVQLYSTKLIDSEDKRIGSLFVITDISQIKKLERIRQDFVANVSHELKTPITTIKGFVETIEGVQIKDKKTIKKYLSFIAKNTDRMNAIITDLLELSRLEQQEYDTKILLKKHNIKLVIEAAIQECDYQISKKSINIELDCGEKIKAPLDIGLMSRAITNLLDNAIQYSNKSAKVLLTVKKVADTAIISVTDSGPGIETKHLTRLFERFYRVDKSRSRKHGGTGLGLAIVKHIANIHNGNVSVESKVGEGSIFSIIIPTE
jgi:two-component system phosphate regulon sensor histidine kinase PhoR